jgi:hypothetical protein
LKKHSINARLLSKLSKLKFNCPAHHWKFVDFEFIRFLSQNQKFKFLKEDEKIEILEVYTVYRILFSPEKCIGGKYFLWKFLDYVLNVLKFFFALKTIELWKFISDNVCDINTPIFQLFTFLFVYKRDFNAYAIFIAKDKGGNSWRK